MKIYLAGPDVFRQDAEAWAESARALCRRYGFEPLLPMDHCEVTPERIFQANIDLIRKAQIVVANLDPFRGPEPDSGTAFEVGYALALGKKVCGYVTKLETTLQRVESSGCLSNRSDTGSDKPLDNNGMLIENFGLPCNLMLVIPSKIVEGGLEGCLQAIRHKGTNGE